METKHGMLVDYFIRAWISKDLGKLFNGIRNGRAGRTSIRTDVRPLLQRRCI